MFPLKHHVNLLLNSRFLQSGKNDNPEKIHICVTHFHKLIRWCKTHICQNWLDLLNIKRLAKVDHFLENLWQRNKVIVIHTFARAKRNLNVQLVARCLE
jgi:hypothetical protein